MYLDKLQWRAVGYGVGLDEDGHAVGALLHPPPQDVVGLDEDGDV